MKNDLCVFSTGLFSFNDVLFGINHILIQGSSMFHIFYLDYNTMTKKRLRKCYDFNGSQYVNYNIDYKHKLKLYPYMMERI